MLPNGDVLLGWPVKEGFPNLELRAVSFERHATRYEYGYSKNWYVWKDLQPGKWVLSIYYGTDPWLHGRLLFVTVPEKGEQAAIIYNISVSSGPAVTEGGTATFTFSAKPLPPPEGLAVTTHVSQQGNFAADGATGTKTVTIPASGTATYSVATVDDDRDEADGSLVVILNPGPGYVVSGQPKAEAPVWDNDVVGSSLDCVTTDQDLLSKVQAEASYHAGSGKRDLHEMFTRSLNTLHGQDTYTTVHIKVRKRGEDDWQGSGPTELWQKIYTELDRLEACRGPQIVKIVDGTPSNDQLNSGQSATITTTSGTVRDHDNDSSTPVGIVEGENACFTVTLSPAPSDWQRVKFSVYEGLSSDSGSEISRSGGWDYIAYGHTGVANHGIPTSGTRDICIPTVDDRTDEKDAQVWMQVSDDVGGTGWHRINVYDNDEELPASERKRIPWAEGWTVAFHSGSRALPGPEGNGFHMGIAWGIPEHYRQLDVAAGKDRAGEGRYKGWWGPSVTYCIQIVFLDRLECASERRTSERMAAQNVPDMMCISPAVQVD